MYIIYNILLFINAKYLANAFRFLLQMTIPRVIENNYNYLIETLDEHSYRVVRL